MTIRRVGINNIGIIGLGEMGGGAAAIGEGWLLRDEFSRALAAGSVNGTAAVPGPGTRTVTDTGNIFSITEGVARIGGTTGIGDPYCRYESLSRLAGRILTAQVLTGSDLAKRAQVGFDGDTSGAIDFGGEGIYFDAGGNLAPRDGGAAGMPTAIAVWAVSTEYKIDVILRSAGAYFFIKGGAFTSWTLVWSGVEGNAATLYPAYLNVSGAFNFDASFLRIPDDLWLPTPLLYTVFPLGDQSLNGTVTDASGPDSQVTPQQTWDCAATWAIDTNQAKNTPTEGGDVVTNGGFGSDSDWTKGAGWTIAAGVATHAAGSASDLEQAALTSGTWYNVDYTVSGRTAGQIQLEIHGSRGPARTTNATFEETGRASGTVLKLKADATFDGSIDDVVGKPLTLQTLFATAGHSTADVMIDVKVSTLTTGTQCGIAARVDDPDNPQNFLHLHFDGNGNVVLDEMSGGVYQATIMSVAQAFTANDTLRLDLSDTAFRAYHITNAGVATLLGSGVVTVTSGLYHGMFNTYADNRISLVQVFAKGTGDEYSLLNRWSFD